MDNTLKSKLIEVIKELDEYLCNNKSETEKNFILGRLSILQELLKDRES